MTNCVAGGVRPYHTIMPGFLMRDGAPLMSFGVMGGHMQPQGHVQLVLHTLLRGLNPQAACDAPRWYLGEQDEVALEPAFPEATRSALVARGRAPCCSAARRRFTDSPTGTARVPIRARTVRPSALEKPTQKELEHAKPHHGHAVVARRPWLQQLAQIADRVSVRPLAIAAEPQGVTFANCYLRYIHVI
jgi:hypothetical protein